MAKKATYRPDLIVNPAALRQHVEILSEQLSPRSHRYPENLDKVADYVSTFFESLGARVRQQEFQVNGRKYKNVLAEYGPDTPEILVVGAHYDTDGEQPGADDNASGIAGLLELGRLLSHGGLSSRVVLAAYALEEMPFFRSDFMGSAVHAKSLAEGQASVKLMICLEMIGYFSENDRSQKFPFPLLKLFYPSKGNFIAIVDQVFSNHARRLKKQMNAVTEVPVYSINAPSFIPGVDFSDHSNFWKYGYPAVMVTDTAFYRNEAYHTVRDTADRLDYEKMAQIVYGIFSYLKQVENK